MICIIYLLIFHVSKEEGEGDDILLKKVFFFLNFIHFGIESHRRGLSLDFPETISFYYSSLEGNFFFFNSFKNAFVISGFF